jgi:hypothetical protein
MQETMAQPSDSHEILGGTVRWIGSGGTDFCEFASHPKVILLQPVRYFGGLLVPGASSMKQSTSGVPV